MNAIQSQVALTLNADIEFHTNKIKYHQSIVDDLKKRID